MSNQERYAAAFEKIFKVSGDVLGADFTVENVDSWDSMSHILLMNELEDSFDIMMDADDIIEFDSYMKGIEILKKYEIEM